MPAAKRIPKRKLGTGQVLPAINTLTLSSGIRLSVTLLDVIESLVNNPEMVAEFNRLVEQPHIQTVEELQKKVKQLEAELMFYRLALQLRGITP